MTLPHRPACKAGALLVGHDPIWQAVQVLPLARSVLETKLHGWCPAYLSGEVGVQSAEWSRQRKEEKPWSIRSIQPAQNTKT